jgi:hypothetical protein
VRMRLEKKTLVQSKAEAIYTRWLRERNKTNLLETVVNHQARLHFELKEV